MGFSDSSVSKESAYNAGDTGSIPGLGRSAGEGIEPESLALQADSLLTELSEKPKKQHELIQRIFSFLNRAFEIFKRTCFEDPIFMLKIKYP